MKFKSEKFKSFFDEYKHKIYTIAFCILKDKLYAMYVVEDNNELAVYYTEELLEKGAESPEIVHSYDSKDLPKNMFVGITYRMIGNQKFIRSITRYCLIK